MPAPRTTPTEETEVRIVIRNAVIVGRLHDNPTAQDFLAQLPLTLSFRDLNGVEKIAVLPPGPLDGRPTRWRRAEIGDIGYYAPSRDLVLYYGEVGYWPGIVRIGRFDGDPAQIEEQPDAFKGTVEKSP